MKAKRKQPSAEQLEVAGRSVPSSDIHPEVLQAQEPAATLEQHNTLEKVATAVLTPEETESPHPTEGWQRFAAFTVEYRQRVTADQSITYQTAAYNLEAGADAIWSGIESKAPCVWILEQISNTEKLRLGENERPLPTPTLAPKATPITVAITEVRILQPPTAATPSMVGEPGGVITGFVNSVAPFALEVAFQLAEPVAAQGDRPPTYSAQFFVRDLVSNTKIALGATEPARFVADQLTYMARLPVVTLPSALYHVQVLVVVQNIRPSVAYFEIPVLQVV